MKVEIIMLYCMLVIRSLHVRTIKPYYTVKLDPAVDPHCRFDGKIHFDTFLLCFGTRLFQELKDIDFNVLTVSQDRSFIYIN